MGDTATATATTWTIRATGAARSYYCPESSWDLSYDERQRPYTAFRGRVRTTELVEAEAPADLLALLQKLNAAVPQNEAYRTRWIGVVEVPDSPDGVRWHLAAFEDDTWHNNVAVRPLTPQEAVDAAPSLARAWGEAMGVAVPSPTPAPAPPEPTAGELAEAERGRRWVAAVQQIETALNEAKAGFTGRGIEAVRRAPGDPGGRLIFTTAGVPPISGGPAETPTPGPF